MFYPRDIRPWVAFAEEGNGMTGMIVRQLLKRRFERRIKDETGRGQIICGVTPGSYGTDTFCKEDDLIVRRKVDTGKLLFSLLHGTLRAFSHKAPVPAAVPGKILKFKAKRLITFRFSQFPAEIQERPVAGVADSGKDHRQFLH